VCVVILRRTRVHTYTHTHGGCAGDSSAGGARWCGLRVPSRLLAARCSDDACAGTVCALEVSAGAAVAAVVVALKRDVSATAAAAGLEVVHAHTASRCSRLTCTDC
jgi:hypothetical protein